MTGDPHTRKRVLRRHSLGRQGEFFAACCYLLRGYRVLGRNIRIEGVEVDLVVGKAKKRIVVEVKTRSTASNYDLISAAQMRRLQDVAQGAFSRAESGHDWQFELIEIVPWRLPRIYTFDGMRAKI